VTYPRAIIKAENLYEMAVRKRLGEGKRAWSLYGFKEGLLLELLPIETLEMTCKRLAHNSK
jgi:hypothetical protein